MDLYTAVYIDPMGRFHSKFRLDLRGDRVPCSRVDLIRSLPIEC